MKLLIEIPEEKYNYFILNRNSYKRSIAEQIINGQRLPDDCEILTKEAYADLCMRASEGNCSEIPTGSEKLSSELEKNSKKLEEATTKDDLVADCIDRQATLDAIIKRLGIKNEAYLLEAERVIYQQILAMPSVTPQESKGHWVLTDVEGNKVWHCNCSECGKDPQDYIGGSEVWWLIESKLPKFCPSCGSNNRKVEV